MFLKNAYSAFFSTLKHSYLWKMRGYPQFSFWISIAPDMIYLSHIVIIWEKILPIMEMIFIHMQIKLIFTTKWKRLELGNGP